MNAPAIDRSEVDAAIKQVQEDENLPKDFDRSKVNMKDFKAKVWEILLEDRDPEQILREALIELYGD